MNAKIGKINSDGTREYPAVDVMGASYTRPCTTVNLTGEAFVVVPPNFTQTDMLDALRAEIQPSTKKVIKRDEPNTTD